MNINPNPVKPNITKKIIFWKWKNDDGAATRSVVVEDLGEILIVASNHGNINLPRAQITIFKTMDAEFPDQLP